MTETALATLDANPMVVLREAIARGCDANTLTQLSDLVRTWKDTAAREAFGFAISQFQSRCLPIVKTRQADRYAYAAFEDIWTVIQPLLAELQIGVSFSSPQVDGGMYCCVCTLRVGGYSEAYPFTAPMPNIAEIARKMFLTEPQAFGVVLSYYKRYALCAALNVIVVGEDNDAAVRITQSSGGITEDEAKELGEILQKRGTNWPEFLKWVSERERKPIERLSQMSRDSYEVAKREALEAIAKKKGAKK